MGNNKSSLSRSKLVWKKTGDVCAHCGRPASRQSRTVDHFIPRSQGGGYDIRNLMPLCETCNKERGSSHINPFEFYRYAPKSEIFKCIEYAEDFKDGRRSMSGEVW